MRLELTIKDIQRLCTKEKVQEKGFHEKYGKIAVRRQRRLIEKLFKGQILKGEDAGSLLHDLSSWVDFLEYDIDNMPYTSVSLMIDKDDDDAPLLERIRKRYSHLYKHANGANGTRQEAGRKWF